MERISSLHKTERKKKIVRRQWKMERNKNNAHRNCAKRTPHTHHRVDFVFGLWRKNAIKRKTIKAKMKKEKKNCVHKVRHDRMSVRCTSNHPYEYG